LHACLPLKQLGHETTAIEKICYFAFWILQQGGPQKVLNSEDGGDSVLFNNNLQTQIKLLQAPMISLKGWLNEQETCTLVLTVKAFLVSYFI
jgi:hypothetical protein